MRHGMKKLFSVEGIRIVLDFWASRGHRAVGFLPEVSVLPSGWELGLKGLKGAHLRGLKGAPLARETASETDVTNLSWTRNASSAPLSWTPSLQRSISLATSKAQKASCAAHNTPCAEGSQSCHQPTGVWLSP